LEQYQRVLAEGYAVLTCLEYAQRRAALPALTLVNRIDIDFSVKKAKRLVDMFNTLGIKGSFFVRLHAPEYNPFSFENYAILRELVASGHELGYHSEVCDQSAIWGEDAELCLRRDLAVMQAMFGSEVRGAASHRGMTPWNNLDFWKTRKPRDFGLVYEAYDTEASFGLFENSFYVSDSEWTNWKCYNHGVLVAGDRRSLGEHAAARHPLLYALIHSDTYFDRHPYEAER
jgi:hypothetical protein